MAWSRRKDKLKMIEESIERHARLLRTNVTLDHIRQEIEDRAKMF